MKKVPKYIKEKMHRLAKLSQQTKELSAEIDCFFENNGYDVDNLRSGDGLSLEELEMGNDITEELCMEIEKYDYGKSELFL